MKWNYQILIDSLKKIDLNILLVVLLDLIFYIASLLIYINWYKIIQAKIASFNLPQNIQSLPLSEIQQIAGNAKSFYYLFLASFILVVIAIIFLASIFKGVIWAKTTKTKITLKLISKFFVLNLAWMGFWFLVIVAIAKFADIGSITLFSRIALLLAIYLTGTLYPLFMKEQKFKSVMDAIKLSITKIHMFVLPYFVISMALYILVMLTSLLKFQYAPFTSTVILLFYIAAVRYYLSGLAFELRK